VGLIARRSAGLLAAILLLGACALPADSGAAPDTPSSVPSPVPAPGPEPAPAPAPSPEPAPPGPEPAPAPSPEPAPPGLLEVHFLDVGQGDATLLIHPDVTVLIDTGRFDRRDVAPLLRARGVTRIDLLVVTHPHADHIGQFDRVMSAFDVTEV